MSNLPLRADLYICFDNRLFAIVPKAIGATTARYVTHILLGEAAELWPLFHNTLVQYLAGGASPYLFARFAWAIIQQVKPFVVAGYDRHVFKVRIMRDGGVGRELKDDYGGGGSRSATSSRKRSKPGSKAEGDGDVSEDSDVNMSNEWKDMIDRWQDEMGGWEQQGDKSETTVEEDNHEHLSVGLKAQLEEASLGGRARAG